MDTGEGEIKKALEKFYRLPEIPNDVLCDQRRMSDGDFFDGLDLDYPPLAKVKAALQKGDRKKARGAVLEHFRTRTEPAVTKYHTDPHWSDWGEITVAMRADALVHNK
ncbi:MAG: hypothetical protein JW909_07660, partial [Planctomycetes bacterium]|nr:hypothetical protein [Planctomycetota bacterium]